MVVAFVCELILPSHRGLTRNRDSLAAGNNDQFWEQYQPTLKRRWCHWMISLLEIPWFTRRHQRRIRASKFLASVASDIDVVTDWLFYIKCVSENGEYYDGDGNQQNNKIPPWLVASVLASCILGTIFWFILATDGAIASPVMRFLGHERLSLGYMLLFCVVLEDLPQVVLTFVIEHYFHADQEFTNIAIMNVVVSLYDTFIKLSEAIDQRRGTSFILIIYFMIFVVILVGSISIRKVTPFFVLFATKRRRRNGVLVQREIIEGAQIKGNVFGAISR